MKPAAFVAYVGFQYEVMWSNYVDIPQNNKLYECPFLTLRSIVVSFCLPYGVIILDHYTLLRVMTVYKFVHSNILGMDMVVQK